MEWGDIIDVIGIGASVGEADGSEIVCLSLERWTNIGRLRVAYVRPGEAAEEPHDFPSYPRPGDWLISDDIGTQYEVSGGGSGGSRAMMDATIIFMPTPRSPASELTIVPPGRSSKSLRVALPEQPED